jgi:ABC-type glycerol-3-phosphate transport system substrate-binding protein
LNGGDVTMEALLYRIGSYCLISALSLFLFGFAISVESGHSAEVKPTWEVTWENTVAAAKKEGRLNFYVGRYGSEPLLNEFRKEFPEIKLVTVNGTGNSLGTRIIAEARAGNVLADIYSGGAVTNFEILYRERFSIHSSRR